MKNASRLSPEVIERLQELARVDDGVETADDREPNARRGVVSFPVPDNDCAAIRLDPGVWEWFRSHAQPGATVEAEIHRVLSAHIAEQMRKAS